jgi:hypothetical protein
MVGTEHQLVLGLVEEHTLIEGAGQRRDHGAGAREPVIRPNTQNANYTGASPKVCEICRVAASEDVNGGRRGDGGDGSIRPI